VQIVFAKKEENIFSGKKSFKRQSHTLKRKPLKQEVREKKSPPIFKGAEEKKEKDRHLCLKKITFFIKNKCSRLGSHQEDID
jgi:hypothetical protein